VNQDQHRYGFDGRRVFRSLAGRRVLITGHTGFCGGWLALWLHRLGCDVHGLSLPPSTTPSLFEAAHVAEVVKHHLLDIREAGRLRDLVQEISPEIIFHLAAQPLVRLSYREPAETFAVNAVGTANVLDAARQTGCRAVVVVTTDKVYQNREWIWPYREDEPLGGHDPYSASKACAELVAASFRSSYTDGPAIATARGGNIIGGGDWSEDRLIPDFVRAVVSGTSITLRNPAATRPWQHVLALCHGYITLAAALLETPEIAMRSWNFGPDPEDAIPVSRIVQRFEAVWKKIDTTYQKSDLHEAKSLSVDSTLARNVLGWLPAWNLDLSLQATAEWYRDVIDRKQDARMACESQITSYVDAMLRNDESRTVQVLQ